MTDMGETAGHWYSDDTATFGDRLVDAREAVGMTQEDLARRVGVKPATLANWENDAAEPRASRLNILSGLLNVSLRWLLTGQGAGLDAPDTEPGTEPGTGGERAEILAHLRRTQAELAGLSGQLEMLEQRLKRAWKS